MENNNFEGQAPNRFGALKHTLIAYAVIGVGFALFMAVVFPSSFSSKSGYVVLTSWNKVLLFILGTTGGTLGMSIGRILRDLVQPDFIMTGDGMKGLVKARLFWAIGPQGVGLIVGWIVSLFLFFWVIG